MGIIMRSTFVRFVGRCAKNMIATAGLLTACGAEQASALEFGTTAPIEGPAPEFIETLEAPGGPAPDELAAEAAAVEISDGVLLADPCAACPGCEACGKRSSRRCPPTPYGMFNRLIDRKNEMGVCWTGRADLLLMWRNAPPAQPLYSAFDPATSTIGAPIFNANQLESTLAAGPRFSLFRTDRCGHAWETTYFRAFNFRSQEQLPIVPNGYALTPPGVFGNSFTNVSAAAANLGSGIQSWELNHRRKVANNLSLLAGFRWVEWRESLSLLDAAVDPNVPSDIYFDSYSTNCMNSLYGGQIGFDTHLIQLGSWLRVDSWMKGGAYYNNAVQTSVYQTGIIGGAAEPAIQTSAQIGAAAFVGELGMMGSIPLTRHLDLQFGYLGLWLESLAQPTNQLFGQTLVSGQPASGSITTTGGTVVQGFTLGLAGRW